MAEHRFFTSGRNDDPNRIGLVIVEDVDSEADAWQAGSAWLAENGRGEYLLPDES
ncbi:hypothetical protein [Streptomyces sp. HD]|uniref:hypothetical protein n=1 Tax=Streptomyces sp. HD TaxID=3020892 RepID=UPI00232B2C33|nr:hypothetical protein [Streptomyces sp. HD]MDC0772786.1 hypothetical protein [Streptomyces sp. HD]